MLIWELILNYNISLRPVCLRFTRMVNKLMIVESYLLSLKPETVLKCWRPE